MVQLFPMMYSSFKPLRLIHPLPFQASLAQDTAGRHPLPHLVTSPSLPPLIPGLVPWSLLPRESLDPATSVWIASVASSRVGGVPTPRGAGVDRLTCRIPTRSSFVRSMTSLWRTMTVIRLSRTLVSAVVSCVMAHDNLRCSQCFAVHVAGFDSTNDPVHVEFTSQHNTDVAYL